MQIDAQFLLLAAIVLFAFTTEAATGFGGTVIALSLGVRLYPIHRLLPMLVPLNLILSSYIVARHHTHNAHRLLLGRILPLMGIGLTAGLVVFHTASGDALKMTFGAFVVILAVRELTSWSRDASTQPLSATARTAGLIAAGLAHGIFATGGPLLVYVLSRSDLDKRSFRSTLATVWLTLNVALTVAYILTGRLDATALPGFGALAPIVPLSIVAGEWAHQRLDEQRFRATVFALLIISGLSILV